MRLDNWAARWNIPSEALAELRAMITREHPQSVSNDDTTQSEAAVLNAIRLEASRKGLRLWRNNVGATYTDRGDFIRYGLANDSHAVNAVLKSADLIGIRPVLITADHVGATIGQFVSREVKAKNWRYRDTARESAQRNWAYLINAMGGDACFATSEGTL